MKETEKCRERRIRDGEFDKYFIGSGIDIGCGDDPLSLSCQHWDMKEGDAQYMIGASNAAYDFVYSSHCLEHMIDPGKAVLRWWELVKPSGYLYVVVPDEDLYEQGIWPPRWNDDHKATFTEYKKKSWSPKSINIKDLAKKLPGGTVEFIRTMDTGYDHSEGVWDRTLGSALAHIEFCVRKNR